VRFSRGANSSFEGHLKFASGLFELDEKRHASHARGDNLEVLDGQLAWVRAQRRFAAAMLPVPLVSASPGLAKETLISLADGTSKLIT
jgi:hypothetical protein